MTRIFSLPDNSSIKPPFARPRSGADLPFQRPIENLPIRPSTQTSKAPRLLNSSLITQMPVKPILAAIPTDENPQLDHLTLSELLMRCPRVPGSQAVLGICADGLPVLFDLKDPRPGPVIVLGNPGCGKTTLLKTMLQSAMKLSDRIAPRYTILTQHPEEFETITGTEFREGQVGVFKPDSREAWNAIASLNHLLDERKEKSESFSPWLVLIDDLTFVRSARLELQIGLEQLLKRGPLVDIWPVAVLSASEALQMGRWLRYFRTRIIGNMSNAAAARLGVFGGIDAEKLLTARQFSVYIAGEWLSFWIPRLDDELETGG
jgi:hypothetical protein